MKHSFLINYLYFEDDLIFFHSSAPTMLTKFLLKQSSNPPPSNPHSENLSFPQGGKKKALYMLNLKFSVLELPLLAAQLTLQTTNGVC